MKALSLFLVFASACTPPKPTSSKNGSVDLAKTFGSAQPTTVAPPAEMTLD